MSKPTKNYLRYLPISDRDRQWGLFVNDAGWQTVAPGQAYPLKTHPRSYAFHWERGRTLPEYQLIYIDRGEGEFDSEMSGPRRVGAGSMMLLFPGVWHRYRPVLAVGWDEYWIGYQGEHADRLQRNGFLSPQNPILDAGPNATIRLLYQTVIERLQSEPPGFEQMIAANTLEIVAAALGAVRTQSAGSRIYNMVREAKVILETQMLQAPRMEGLASSLGLSPTHFHRVFKEHTGLTPYQYHMQVRLMRAKGLLGTTTMTIQEISRSLGFETAFHFTNSFRTKTGVSPSQWRRDQNIKGETLPAQTPETQAQRKAAKSAKSTRRRHA